MAYAAGEAMEIPVKKLLKKNAGDLNILDRNIVKAIRKLIPKHQSAFNAALPVLRAANDGILDETIPGIAAAVFEAELIWNDLIKNGARRIVELLLKHGINETNVMQQKWIAAIGPMPKHPDPSAPGVTAAMLNTLRMKVAFYKLVDVIRKTDLPHKWKCACKADLSCILEFSWDGIYH